MPDTIRKLAPVTLYIYDNETRLVAATTDDQGNWSCPLTGLTNGDHVFTARLDTLVSSARKIHISVQLKNPPAPYVDHPKVSKPINDKQTVPYYEIDSDIDIVIPDYGMVAGDTVKLYWVSRNTTYGSAIQTVSNPPRSLTFKIPRFEVVDAIGYVSTKVHYTVTRPPSTERTTSRILSVDVTGRPGQNVLPPPRLVDGNSTLEVAKSWLNSASTVEVRAIGKTIWESNIQTFGAANTLKFPISRSWISSNKGTQVRFTYSVRVNPDDGQRYSYAQLLRVNPL